MNKTGYNLIWHHIWYQLWRPKTSFDAKNYYEYVILSSSVNYFPESYIYNSLKLI